VTRRNAHINPIMLTWARKGVKLSVDLAAAKIGVKEEALQSWENGNSQPTINQLFNIAKVYGRPFALFYFPEPPKHFQPIKDFRKFPRQFVKEEDPEYIMEKELLLFQQKREVALDLYEELGTEVPKFTLTGTLEENAANNLADKIIDFLDINHGDIAKLIPGYDALNYWKKLLANKGILIFQTTGVPLQVMRGACLAMEELPVIIINSNDSQNGRIFTLFHELVHIVLRESGVSNFTYRQKDLHETMEVQCNQVAAEILVPERFLFNTNCVRSHREGENSWTNVEISELSRLFCVSREVILRRLLTLGRTSLEFYQDYRAGQALIDKKEQKGGNYYRNVIAKNGSLYLNLVLEGYHQGKVTASALSDYLNMKVSNLKNLENMLYG